MINTNIKLVVTDIDNTLFDWVAYYGNAFPISLRYVADQTGIDYDLLLSESRDIFTQHSIEYPFLVQSLPSVIRGRSRRQILELASNAREVFKSSALPYLIPYVGVETTLASLKKKGIPIVALTDAPRYVAMWKLNKLGILHYFDAIYGLEDPKLPVSTDSEKVLVDEELLLKHLRQTNFNFQGRVRTLPDDYEKPGTKGFKTILMEFDLDKSELSRQIMWIGDNLKKDVELGSQLGVVTAWAKYGAANEGLQQLLQFSPLENIRKNASIEDSMSAPDIVLSEFSDILSYLE